MGNRNRKLALLAILLCFGVAAWQYANQPPARPEAPTIDLEQIRAKIHGEDVILLTPPSLPGPYRRSVKGGMMLNGGKAGEGMIYRVKDKTGAVLEEVNLSSSVDYDYIVEPLNTLDGRETLAVFRRKHVK